MILKKRLSTITSKLQGREQKQQYKLMHLITL